MYETEKSLTDIKSEIKDIIQQSAGGAISIISDKFKRLKKLELVYEKDFAVDSSGRYFSLGYRIYYGNVVLYEDTEYYVDQDEIVKYDIQPQDRTHDISLWILYRLVLHNIIIIKCNLKNRKTSGVIVQCSQICINTGQNTTK